MGNLQRNPPESETVAPMTIWQLVKSILVWAFFLIVSIILWIWLHQVEILIHIFIKPYVWPYYLEVLYQTLYLIDLFSFVLFMKIVYKTNLIPVPVQKRIERLGSKLIQEPFTLVLSSVIIVWLGLWLPHYLYWPWWMDLEHFSLSAHSWDQGVRPYRDIIDFNFPGPIYFMWIVGKVFGWDNPMVANLLDAGVLILLGILLIRWSREKFDSVNPGLLCCLLIARYYMSLDYSRVMQRDWHLIAAGVGLLLIMQITRSRHKYLLAGVAVAITLVIRPYAILIVPAIVFAMVLDQKSDLVKLEAAMKQFIISGLVSTLLLWSPLLVHGIADDFFCELIGEIMHSNYRPSDQESILVIMFDQLNRNIIFSALCALIAAIYMAGKDREKLRLVLVWFVLFLSMLFYKVLCPVRHNYTEIPLEIVACVSLGVFWGILEKYHGVLSVVKIFLVGFWFWHYFPGLPVMLSWDSSRESVVALFKGEPLKTSPPGCALILKSRTIPNYSYSWDDYQAALNYIREETTPDVQVVNFLRLHPFPTFNGPTGRLTLWPCGEGFQWLRWVHPELELEFANALRNQVPSIVIWNDRGEPRPLKMAFPVIEQVIRLEYEPVARFGEIDIWKKRRMVDQATGS